MALIKDFETVTGLVAKDAYIRVEQISLNKSRMTAEVRWYKQPTGYPHFHSQVIECPFDLSGANPISQAYGHIKTLSEFIGAEDC